MAMCVLRWIPPSKAGGEALDGTWEWVPPEGYQTCTMPNTGETGGTGDQDPPDGGSESGIGAGPCGYGYYQSYELIPDQPAIPGSPGEPPTEASFYVDMNIGWNTWARSLYALPDDAYLEFTVNPNSYGIFVGLGPVGMDGMPFSAFDHGLMFDVSGIHLFENGVLGDSVSSLYFSSTVCRIYRDDTTVTYNIAGSPTASANTILSTDELFVYAYQYTANDEILSAQFKLTIDDSDIDGDIPSDSGDGDMSGDLPAMNCLMSYSTDYSLMAGDLPATTAALSYPMFVPETPVYMIGSLEPMTAMMLMTTSCPGDMAGELPATQMIAGDYDYGILNGSLGAMTATMRYGERLKMTMYSSMVMVSGGGDQVTHVLVFMSGLQVQSIQTATNRYVMSLLDSLQVSGSVALLGTYKMSCVGQVGLHQYVSMARDGRPAFDESSRVWVVNLDSGAATQYDNFGFNSYFTRNGKHYGVADDGIYLLEGESDNDLNIDASIDLGVTRFKARADVPAVYVNAKSDSKLQITVSADDGKEYTYEARSSSEDLKTHRFDIGRGLTGTNWHFVLKNNNGSDFELESMSALPVISKRRV